MYKYKQRRGRRIANARKLNISPDLVPDPLPQHPIETNGYTEWEMPTSSNTHEISGCGENDRGGQQAARIRRSFLGI